MSTQRLEGETFENYKIRLCRDRNELGLTWPDVATLLGSNPDTVRKWYSSFEDGYDYALRESATSSGEIEALENKRLELEIERKKRQTVNVEYNKVLREEARKQMLFDEIRNSIEAVRPPEFNQLQVNRGDIGAVLGFSDIHYGKRFSSLNNTYNTEIAKQRMNKLLSEIIAICKKEGIDILDIVNGGDGAEGISLRISQLQSLQLGLVDSVIEYARMMVEWLNELSRHVRIRYHHIKSANHTEIRPLGTGRGEFPNEDMEKIVHMYIKDMLKNNDRIEVPDHPLTHVRFEVKGNLIYGLHGHTLKGRNIESVVKDLSMMHREFIDTVIVGHFHHGKEVTVSEGSTYNKEVLQLPSLMGSDEYSDSLLTGAKPGAKLFLFEEGKGKTISYDIKL